MTHKLTSDGAAAPRANPRSSPWPKPAVQLETPDLIFNRRRPSKRKSLSALQVGQILALRTKGMTLKAIAVRYERGIDTIPNVVHGKGAYALKP